MSAPVYLVVEPIEIIASDLAMNVQDYDPAAVVLIALTPAQGCKALLGYTSVRVAFVHYDPSAFLATDLATVLDRLGARVVFTGDAAERRGAPYFVLQRPFSANTTAELLQRAEKPENA